MSDTRRTTTYTRAELLALRLNAPRIGRRVRKVLFALRLWQPANCRSKVKVDDHFVNNNTSRNKVRTTMSTGCGYISAACLNVCSIRNKTAVLSDVINEHKLEIFALTETHHEDTEDVAIKKLTLPGYRCIDAANKSDRYRLSGRSYGGLAIVYKDTLTARVNDLNIKPSTFEILVTTFKSVNVNIVFVVIYRPGSDNVSQVFFDELTRVLEAVAVFNSHVVITGDFDIKLNDIDNAHTKHLTELLNSFGLVQSIVGPTHNRGNTLVVLITRSDLPLPDDVVVHPPQVSDHSLICFSIPVKRPPLQYTDVATRAWKSFDADKFRDD